MIGAIITLARRGEYPNFGVDVLLAIMAAVVAWLDSARFHFEVWVLVDPTWPTRLDESGLCAS
jgi:hypothetical protein